MSALSAFRRYLAIDASPTGEDYATVTSALERDRVNSVLNEHFTHQELARWSEGWVFVGRYRDGTQVTTKGFPSADGARGAAAKAAEDKLP